MNTPQPGQHLVSSDPVKPQELTVVPQRGHLVALKTKDELRAALETIDVYVIEVPATYAGAILNIVKNAIPDLKTVNLQHLRRVVQLEFLPEHLQKKFSSSTQAWGRLSTTGDAIGEQNEGGKRPIELRYLLIAPTSLISSAELRECLMQNHPFLNSEISPHVHTIPVPALAPTSAEQAAKWTQEYWSISYKNTNPYGPHPSLLARAAADIESHAGTWLALARTAGEETKAQDLGEEIGCVIIEKTGNEKKILAVAGDARWCSMDGTPVPHKQGPGNVMAHAVMRAIGMVGRKRLRVADTNPGPESDSGGLNVASVNVYCDTPLTPIESDFFTDNIAPGGYLCVDLDIYVTHEPCVMCSMAILHSRFKRCVFGSRMPLTGGLTAEMPKSQEDGQENSVDAVSGLGYGIFWRPSELNWKFLAWEWESESEEGGALSVDLSIQA
ncbi:cytidine deaminase-like protein [Glonium stellatum]|uniref:Cytidine deaminase-like protein n=1 Tax=Glonium stellatum TaxID=574774 RepID=A0A8E2JTZ1_9PEZI|nr:cytidine deaminase-like protein [Glonium stellatum]